MAASSSIEERAFGIEFEFYLPYGHGVSFEMIARFFISRGVPATPCKHGGKPLDPTLVSVPAGHWRVEHDSSIEASTRYLFGMGYELVSPKLHGMQGLQDVQRALEVAVALGSHVNDTCGVHVHIDSADRRENLEIMKNMCSQFVKFESTIDLIMPRSRIGNPYCHSNLASVGASPLATIRRMPSVSALVDLMNKPTRGRVQQSARYYRVNFQKLAAGRIGTSEFRQHWATTSFTEASNWITFLLLFTQNSADQPATEMFQSQLPVERLQQLFTLVPHSQLEAYFFEIAHKRGRIPSATVPPRVSPVPVPSVRTIIPRESPIVSSSAPSPPPIRRVSVHLLDELSEEWGQWVGSPITDLIGPLVGHSTLVSIPPGNMIVQQSTTAAGGLVHRLQTSFHFYPIESVGLQSSFVCYFNPSERFSATTPIHSVWFAANIRRDDTNPEDVFIRLLCRQNDNLFVSSRGLSTHASVWTASVLEEMTAADFMPMQEASGPPLPLHPDFATPRVRIQFGFLVHATADRAVSLIFKLKQIQMMWSRHAIERIQAPQV